MPGRPYKRVVAKALIDYRVIEAYQTVKWLAYEDRMRAASSTRPGMRPSRIDLQLVMEGRTRLPYGTPCPCLELPTPIDEETTFIALHEIGHFVLGHLDRWYTDNMEEPASRWAFDYMVANHIPVERWLWALAEHVGGWHRRYPY